MTAVFFAICFDVASIVIWIFELPLDQSIRAARVDRILLGFERGLVVVAIAEDRSGYVVGVNDRCYIETDGEKYCGHFLLRRVNFAPQKLSIEIARPRDNLISVTFAMTATEFAEASQVVKMISGEIEPP